MAFRLPRRDSRATIIGGTGSGKTVFAAWLLSRADLSTRPWLAIDYKRDRFFSRLLRERAVRLVSPGHRFRRGAKGLVVVRPRLGADNEAMRELFEHLWSRGNCGVWIDELYSVPQGDALDSLYYQGRSKNIQIIGSMQRPVDVTRFAISEADYFSVFRLRDSDDIRRIKGFVPAPALTAKRPPYHSLWYDAAEDKQYLLTPAPSEAESAAAIRGAQAYRYW